MVRLLPLVALLALGCSDVSIDSGQTPIGSARSVRFTQEYGFCLGRCFRSLEITAQGAATLIVRDRADTAPLSTRSFALQPADRDRLFDLARAAAEDPWEAQYGCPDCVDQGRYELTVRGSAAARSAVIDPQEHPAAFDDLLGELERLVVDHLP